MNKQKLLQWRARTPSFEGLSWIFLYSKFIFELKDFVNSVLKDIFTAFQIHILYSDCSVIKALRGREKNRAKNLILCSNNGWKSQSAEVPIETPTGIPIKQVVSGKLV